MEQVDHGHHPTSGSAGPITATAASGSAQHGPATFFSSGPLTVSTQGRIGPDGSATTSSRVQSVTASGDEPLTAASLSSTCTASGSGLTGSTTVIDGTLRTSDGDPPVAIPVNPAPQTTYHGTNAGGDFHYVFNEQVTNPDGSITVNAAHQYLLGPTAVGELIIGQSVCGVTASPVPADTSPPETTITAGPGEASTIGDASPSFEFTGADDLSPPADLSFECKLDDGPFEACTSPRQVGPLTAGPHSFSVRAGDHAGNIDPTPASRAFTAEDTARPSARIVKLKVKHAKRTAKLSFRGVDDRTAAAELGFRCKLDRKRFRPCASPKRYKRLKPGRHRVAVKAIDAAGNESTPARTRFRVKRV